MTLEQLSSFLGWAAVCNIIFLSVMFFGFLACRELIYNLHGRWFGLPKETINAILYVQRCDAAQFDVWNLGIYLSGNSARSKEKTADVSFAWVAGTARMNDMVK